ncbi:MAG: N-6 DNA methylase, partial [Chloroflexi bacterium]|nr:N-6 DNA methylase [Chloroflexota bacterium]
MSEDRNFADALREFAAGVAADSATPIRAQPEDQLKAPVQALLSAAGELWSIETRSRTEAQAEGGIGRPDIGVAVEGLLCGYVELKPPGRGARPEMFRGHDRDQWQRFKCLPNLIYTDGSEWGLYRNGERVGERVRIADDLTSEGVSGLEPAAPTKLAGLLRDFLMHSPVTPTSAQGLAEFLAPLSRLLRDEVRDSLNRDQSAVNRIAEEWRRVLFPNADSAQFADAYAQTVTYALLLARFEGAENLRQALAVDQLREAEHDLLATALDWLQTRAVREELSMPIDLLERAIAAVNAQALLADRGRQSAFEPAHETDRDPWLYFYEHFLGAYDAELRRNRGVYFTPVEIVHAQVRFAGELLRSRLGRPLAFAESDVEVLDPACGTGTYPIAVLQHAARAVHGQRGPGAVPSALRDLAARLHAFEIL